jgi:pimeloyl-ACP methyl ester carboxylesterase
MPKDTAAFRQVSSKMPRRRPLKTLGAICVGFLLLIPIPAVSQSKLVDRTTRSNGKSLHFRILEGRKDDIILFESGGGNDSSVWEDLLVPVAEGTGATLITYDRPGLGSSEIDSQHHGLTGDIERLESGLEELGYTGHYTVVAHSLGGFYATLFASRHPDQVRAAVLIDINLACFFTDTFLPTIRRPEAEIQKLKTENPAKFFFAVDFEPMVLKMRSVEFPNTMPVLDFVAEQRDFPTSEDFERWRSCHSKFASEAPNRTEYTAYGSGHYIFISNPELIVAAILQAHALANGTARPELAYAVRALDEQKRKDSQYARSEDALNQWGYDLLRTGNNLGAVKVFELNVSLRPNSASAYDSLGDGYKALGDMEAAIRSYTQAVKLDPKAKHSAEKLRLLSAPR